MTATNHVIYCKINLRFNFFLRFLKFHDTNTTNIMSHFLPFFHVKGETLNLMHTPKPRPVRPVSAYQNFRNMAGEIVFSCPTNIEVSLLMNDIITWPLCGLPKYKKKMKFSQLEQTHTTHIIILLFLLPKWAQPSTKLPTVEILWLQPFGVVIFVKQWNYIGIWKNTV